MVFLPFSDIESVGKVTEKRTQKRGRDRTTVARTYVDVTLTHTSTQELDDAVTITVRDQSIGPMGDCNLVEPPTCDELLAGISTPISP